MKATSSTFWFAFRFFKHFTKKEFAFLTETLKLGGQNEKRVTFKVISWGVCLRLCTIVHVKNRRFNDCPTSHQRRYLELSTAVGGVLRQADDPV